MFSTTDTIVAVATPPGRGGLGVVRLSGPEAEGIGRRLIGRDEPLVPRHATLATFRAATLAVVDEVVVTSFPAPASYTAEDVVEVSAHGSPVVLRAIVSSALEYGARLAEPGEFTLRAFLNNRIDLAQAEAVADLIEAATPLQARAAFDQLSGTLTLAIADIDRALFDLVVRLEASVDFPDEGYHFVEPGDVAQAIGGILGRTAALLASARRGRLLREGLQIAIVGHPNVGKSSLFNALLGSPRAIVTAVPGTTRDLVSESLDLEGLQVTLVDTAGLRDTDDSIESEGVRRSLGAIGVADLILLVSDLSVERDEIERWDPLRGKQGKTLLVGNKADLEPAWHHDAVVEVSATTGYGLNELRRRIAAALDIEPLVDRPAMTNMRHIGLVEQADRALRRGLAAASEQMAMSEEFVLADLQEARQALEEVVGRRTSEDLLVSIFSRFCIGK